MSLFVDTSVWSLALRRDAPVDVPETERLRAALRGQEAITTTGLVLQELLQGFHAARASEAIQDVFAAVPLIVPDREDHVEAAALRNECRRRGVQLETIDALHARLCIRHDLTMLSRDRDFHHAARHVPLRVWAPAGEPR